jgi:hypothetical protein
LREESQFILYIPAYGPLLIVRLPLTEPFFHSDKHGEFALL